MSFIRTMQWEAINTMVLSMNEKQDIAQIREDFLRRLELLIPFDGAIFDLGCIYNTKIQYFSPIVRNIDSEYVAEYYKQYKWSEPTGFFFSRNDDNIFRESDYINMENRNKDLFFSMWMQPQGLYFSMNANICSDGVFFGSLNLWRTEENGDFSDNEMEILATLDRHLALCFYRRYPNGVSKDCSCCEGDDFRARFNLTKREADVARMICDGESVANIAGNLFIAESTVNKHLYSVFRKLQVSNRSDLVRLYLSGGLKSGEESRIAAAAAE